MKILHVIERLGRGGAARSMLALAKYSGRGGSRQTVLSLLPPEPPALAMAHDANVDVLAVTDGETRQRAIAAADITHVHFWNTPEMYDWLSSALPPTRLVVTLHVAGEHPAQVATQALLDFADFVVATTPYSLELPRLRQLPLTKRGMVLDSPDFARLRLQPAEPHAGFNVGYVGTVGFVKIHERFVEMSAAARLPGVRFRVCGDGDALKRLARRATELQVAERFEWLGYVDDVAAVLGALDAFGYPLRPDNYATGELVLQEAMYAGVPPVVLAHGAPARLIENGETGLIVDNERQYARALESLYEQPAERRRLASNASDHARSALGAENAAPQLTAVYDQVMTMPKHDRRWHTQRISPHAGADAFVAALGDTAEYFRTSLLAADETVARTAESAVALASPVVTDAAAGGVLHYRRYYPDDPYLRLWAGLVLAAQGRPALAAAELQRSRHLGLAQPRVAEYLAEVLEGAR
jgi:glycosyltransferase involved in cell wall biosynthesis